MSCQTCPHRSSCANMKPPCYIPNEPNIPIKPYGLIEPIYPYPWITSTPENTYYWWMTPVSGNTGDVIIQ